jgi:indolepyruvate ferredoxin oxidoreductase
MDPDTARIATIERRAEFGLDDKYTLEDGEILLSGVQALVRVLFDQLRADRRRELRTAAFVSGYQGSPLGGFDMTLQRTGALLDEFDVQWVPGVNEELGATAIWGSQQDALAPLAHHDGVIGMWYGKSPGLDRSADALRHANLHGVGRNGGVLCAVGDDPQSKSSTFPNASELALCDLAMPVYVPGSPQEILDLGRHAYELSRWSGVWTSMKVVTAVADAIASARVHPDRILTRSPDLVFDGVSWAHRQHPKFFIPDTIEMESELLNRRLAAVQSFVEANPVDEIEIDPPEPRIALVAPGRTYRELREALAGLGLAEDAQIAEAGIRLVRIALAWPLAPSTVARAAAGVEELVVVEEKRSFVESQLREQLYDSAHRPRVLGKRDGKGAVLFPPDGELTADRILPLLYRVLADRLGDSGPLRAPRPALSLDTSAPPRAATFCSGCPHNRSTVEVSGSPMGAGVGCHAMVWGLDRGAISYTQMGGEGAHWVGRAPFTETPHFVQNVGDGTFFHSASLVIRQAVSAGTTMTFKLLYNGVVAMTGGQEPAGLMDVPQLTRMLAAEGVARTVVVSDDPDRYEAPEWAANSILRSRDALEDTERDLASVPGVSVLVYDQACANELRRLRKRGQVPQRTKRVVINERVCEGCGDCGAKSNCLSVQPVETEFGRKTQIHQTSCNTDYSCLDGDCPAFVTIEAGASSNTKPLVAIDLPEISEPAERCGIGEAGYGILLAGVGGTGVVTVNQILATAAFLDGLCVTGLDQTGLAQKGGPVVSHLRLWSRPPATSSSVNDGQADMLLALDPLVAVDPRHAGRASAARTSTIAASALVPTGEMVRNVDAATPDDMEDILDVLRERSLPGRFFSLDMVGLAEAIFGDSLSANVLALGAAYQVGGLPISSAAIERAIEINGVSVERNKEAFRAGRAAIEDPDILPAIRRAASIEWHPSSSALEISDSLARARNIDDVTTRRRGAELIDYQNPALSERYLDLIAEARAAASQAGVDPEPITAAIADGFFHLLAYKDEYEVARLHLLPMSGDAIRHAVPGGSRLRYQIHPPFLRALGMKKKISVAAGVARPIFQLLRSMRRIRGTKADPFGYAHLRRLERRLADEYESGMRTALRCLSNANAPLVADLARLARWVKGYEELKIASASKYEDERATLLARLTNV